jgi:hypothetical protein
MSAARMTSILLRMSTKILQYANVLFGCGVRNDDPKSFDLLNQVSSRLLLVDHHLVEGVAGVFDESLMEIG